jgi:hypothetical protein
MIHDIFLSYKREDEKLAARLAKALEAEGFSVWWDRSLLPAESWRDQIQSALDAAAVTIVIWTQESAGPNGDFVRDEASQAKARGRLVPVMMEKARLPLGFGELQAIDLIGWKGNRSSPFFKDLVAATKAKIAGAPAPKPKGPLQRTMRRASAGIASAASLGAIVAFSSNVMSVQHKVCSINLAQPQISDFCGGLSLGGKPTKEERLAWADMPTGSCDALRAHVERFPEGAFRSAAADMISARRVMQEEVWTPAERTARLYVGLDADPAPTEDAARADAEARATESAESLCAGYANTQSYRVKASVPRVGAWECESYSDGHVCSGQGEAVCAVEVRGVIETESCGGEP